MQIAIVWSYMSSWIFGFIEGRKNAITAWKLDGYIPWDEVEKEYGLSVKDLFNAGLLVKRGRYWRDLPFYPYLLSDLGRLLLSEDDFYAIFLIKKGCLEKVLALCLEHLEADEDEDA